MNEEKRAICVSSHITARETAGGNVLLFARSYCDEGAFVPVQEIMLTKKEIQRVAEFAKEGK